MKVTKPTMPRRHAVAYAAKRTGVWRSSAFSSGEVDSAATTTRGNFVANAAVTMNPAAATPAANSGPPTSDSTPATTAPTMLATALSKARRLLALMRSCSERTSAGTTALLATEYPFWKTRIANARGKSHSESILLIIRNARTARTKAVVMIIRRRPPLVRSMAGPKSGATIANGAMVSAR